ncbi:tRNA pseudouridine synthase A [Zafaria sp. Z1313]|uniref:tRNA pseudouridine synthase A n=1 Tax=unclassified Zafaria TaxID=2828765 RepID=UPI002E77CACF|nr:tRNA pseudouridine synthase A [Zafaria sp. J156]MEE1620524.1 tRNA pseudouridine synthase A [Zafaria sp. J156]
MDLAYDGTGFSGWATQPGRRTVQGLVEEALALLFRRPVRTTVAGRTDAGVHARGQVVHFDLTPDEYSGLPRGKDIPPETALVRRLRGVMGRYGSEVVVHAAALAGPGFDARFSALWRRYSYRIADGGGRWDPLTRNDTLWFDSALDVDALNAEAAALNGRHDFLSFCKPREGATTIRTLEEFRFDRGADGIIVAHLRADAFCHNMVRTLVGAVLRVGDGREEPGWLALRLGQRIRDARTTLAAPHPLVLEEVAYPADAELAARAELTRARRTPADAAR